ncbi:MAG: sigma-54 dependent transcriptional regulator [Thiomicrospira sp.]|jgi:DNA-binding NtrC family response regulator|nr:sigma-54 dependent transcriptional regulator [Thiomicrospira sp.]
MQKNAPTTTATLLVVDDEKDIRSLMQEIFVEEGYRVKTAANGVQARQAWRDQVPDVIFLDVWMPDIDGISLIKEMVSEQLLEHTTVVMMSGHGTIETAIEATRHGAYDFLEKPLSLAKLIVTAERALQHNRLKHENQRLKQAQPGLVMPIGKSKAMRELRDTVERLGKYTMPILAIGEAGSGKQFFAQAIHQHSARANQPIVHLSAQMLSEQLSHWLGSVEEKSARVGQIEQIKGGTLVIANVEQLSAAGQNFLAEIIFEQGYRRLNSDKLHPLDLRLICSTRENLELHVSAGRFREDLFKRLNVMPILIPALRQHSEDMEELVTFFMQSFIQQEGLQRRHFSEDALHALRQYSWPGNLRELKNLVQRLLILGHGEVLADEVKHSLTQSSQQYYNAASIDTSMDLKTAKEQFEAAYLKQLLRETCGSVTETARRSGIERTHLYRKLKALEIDPKDPI